MDNNEEWISITEMDRRIKMNQASWQAAKQFIASIDWPLFKEQYAWISEANTNFFQLEMVENYDVSSGIMQFMEAVKDLAVDHFGVPEADAYTFTEEE